MADKRINFPIPPDTWVLVLTASTSATLYKEDTGPNYISLLYDDVGDDPNSLHPLPENPGTAQLMFTDGVIEDFNDSVPTYYWVACKSSKSGTIIVTP